MFIDRWAGAMARSCRSARAAMAAGGLFVALASLVLSPAAFAHEGHDHGTASAALPATLQPRAVAVGDEIEVVAILRGDDLLIHVDRFADNMPVTKATVIVTVGKTEYRAAINGEGVFQVKSPVLVRPGANELIIGIQDASFNDLLIATLALPVASQPIAVAGDAPRRLADGSVFLPKPTQRLLGVRTMQVKETVTRPSYSLVGRIIPNPDKSGVVQSTVNGRLAPPVTGLPRLGQTVKAGDVLAYVTPAFMAIDSTNVAQTAGELDQQIELAKTKLARGQRLLAANAGTRVTVEEAELLLRGLERRRAALGQSQIKSEPLLAPVDGVIASAKVMAGQVVAPQDILFEIIDPASLLVEALVFDPAAPQKFDSASAQSQDGATFDLTFIGRSRALRQQSSILHFAIANPPATLNVGMPVTVYAQAGEQVAGLLIPKAALVRGANGEDVVWRHTEPERFIATPVKVAAFDGERVLVQSGLKPGERVVVLGAELINQVR